MVLTLAVFGVVIDNDHDGCVIVGGCVTIGVMYIPGMSVLVVVVFSSSV